MPLPLSEVTQHAFQQMIDMGNGEQDNAAVLSVFEAETGVHVGPEPQ
jgi:3-hydroxyisobutyrate dehydrogenase-like beta-hydroxyacid dehydrogenase